MNGIKEDTDLDHYNYERSADYDSDPCQKNNHVIEQDEKSSNQQDFHKNQGVDCDSDDSLADPDYEQGEEQEQEDEEQELESEEQELEDEEQGEVSGENNPDQGPSRVKKGRKRRRHEGSWKVNVKKNKVTTGQEHFSNTKTIRSKKEIGPTCAETCPLKCTQKLTPECRQTINEMFYQLDKDIDQKRQFVASHVETVPVERIRSRTGRRQGARTNTRLYFFEINGTRSRVCATMFLNTLRISTTFVSTALTKKILNAGGITNTDLRGKHGKHSKIPDVVRQNVRDHIMKFPSAESHYSRERSKRKFLGNHLNLSKMYNLYKSECEEMNLTENLIAKEWLYSEIFNTEFNLSFKPPNNDTCDQCDFFLVSLRDVQNEEEKKKINGDYQEHLAEASKRYSLKKKDKEDALKRNPKSIMLCVDLQKCLPTPVLTNSQSFYSLKLWTYNYTLYDATHKKTTCVMWDESKAGRGGNEMASGMLKWALSNIKPGLEELIIWSDNCPSQNRNMIMVMTYFWIISLFPTIKTISHKFLLRGHTHLEVDACHSLIERERKNVAGFQIMTPWDWQQLARMCSVNNPFEIINMETEDFKDFKKLYANTSSPFMSRKKNSSGEEVFISKMVEFNIRGGAEHKGILYYRNDFDSDFKKVDLNRTGRRVTFPKEIPPVREGLNPLSTKKYQHLQNLLKWIPKQFHQFYRDLPHRDRDAGEEEEEGQ